MLLINRPLFDAFAVNPGMPAREMEVQHHLSLINISSRILQRNWLSAASFPLRLYSDFTGKHEWRVDVVLRVIKTDPFNLSNPSRPVNHLLWLSYFFTYAVCLRCAPRLVAWEMRSVVIELLMTVALGCFIETYHRTDTEKCSGQLS